MGPLPGGRAQPTLVGLGRRLPVLIADDGQAHLAINAHVGVVDLGCERHRGGSHWIFLGEVDAQVEGPEVVGRLLLCKKRSEALFRGRAALKGSFSSLGLGLVSSFPAPTPGSKAASTPLPERIMNGYRWHLHSFGN